MNKRINIQILTRNNISNKLELPVKYNVNSNLNFERLYNERIMIRPNHNIDLIFMQPQDSLLLACTNCTI